MPNPAEPLSATEEAATTNIERQEWSLPAVLKVNHSLLDDKSSYTLEFVLDSLSEHFLLATNGKRVTTEESEVSKLWLINNV